MTAFYCSGCSTNTSEETFAAQGNFKHKKQKFKGISTCNYKINIDFITNSWFTHLFQKKTCWTSLIVHGRIAAFWVEKGCYHYAFSFLHGNEKKPCTSAPFSSQLSAVKDKVTLAPQLASLISSKMTALILTRKAANYIITHPQLWCLGALPM